MPWTDRIRAGSARWGPIVLCVLAVLAWLRYAPPEAPWSPQNVLGAILPPPKVITEHHTVTVPGPERLKIIKKEVIVERWHGLPTPPTVSDNAAVVTAVADIPASPEGGTAISVLRPGSDNVAVGHIEYMPTPAPFFKVKRELGIRGGYGTPVGVVAELYARPFRIGPVEVEGRVFGSSGNGEGSNFGAAIMLDWRF